MIMKRIFNIIIYIFASIGIIFSLVLIFMQFNLLSVPGNIKDRNKFFIDAYRDKHNCQLSQNKKERECIWMYTEEFKIIEAGLEKDKEIIDRVSKETNISPKLIKSVIIAEQLRFFTSERESYKKWFEPLKILGTMSKFSLGVSGIKPDTARAIENNLINNKSDLYLNNNFARLLLTDEQILNKSINEDGVIFDRLTNNKDHYYSYLYTAIFIKEIITGWQKAGYNIDNNAGIIATIFNLGFDKSIPNNNPQIGGSTIDIAGNKYYYGELADLYFKNYL